MRDSIDPRHAGARLSVDLGALTDNWRHLAGKVAPAVCAAVVKADAYGLGLGPVAEALWQAGARVFFVALPDEAIRLRALLPRATIHVLGGLFRDCLDDYRAFDLVPVINTFDDWQAFAEFSAGHARPLAATLHVDTGMNRLGVSLAEARTIAARIAAQIAAGDRAEADLLLVLSHLACADTPGHPLTAQQIARFERVRALFPTVPASLANSAGIAFEPQALCDLVRPGIAVYGGRFGPAPSDRLKNVVRLEARILQIRSVAAGETVGYGATQTSRRDSRIATLSLGYADGFHRLAGATDLRPGASGWLRGRSAPLFGRVSMDLIGLDVTDIPDARPGDWVEIIGDNAPLSALSAAMDTIDYEVLTGLGHRFTVSYLPGK